MQQFSTAGYDRALTVFSPDGRLFQIEYAREAVKRGTTSVGIVSKDGVVFAVDKKVKSKLVVPSSIEKIFKIDEHIATASSGLVADARRLVDIARRQAQVNKLQYHEPISVTGLAKYIGDLEQMYTQSGGIRPFGISLIIGGVSDGECRIYETDPSGALVEYKATAIGFGREKALELFEDKYDDNLSLDEAIDLAIEGIYKATDGKVADDSVEISIVDKESATYKKLDAESIETYVTKVVERKEQEKKEAEEKAKKEAEEKEARKAELKAKKEAEEKEAVEQEENSANENSTDENVSDEENDQ
ncbi:MAG: proteasome endopeptidase complex, archaeal, alpha subunit [Methanosphaera sp. rholeuAM270]|nr:MAG: proteasome endopeptidase complex, archaeal, alpha subunit [Methanosphaera sp. rholeuAM270]